MDKKEFPTAQNPKVLDEDKLRYIERELHANDYLSKRLAMKLDERRPSFFSSTFKDYISTLSRIRAICVVGIPSLIFTIREQWKEIDRLKRIIQLKEMTEDIESRLDRLERCFDIIE